MAMFPQKTNNTPPPACGCDQPACSSCNRSSVTVQDVASIIDIVRECIPDASQGPQGPAGADGVPGVDGQDGAPGAAGQDGAAGTPGADGQDGADGAAGATPTIGANGNWFINGVDTGVPAAGTAEIPSVGVNGNWFISGVDTGVPATGPQGPAGADGNDGADGAQGIQGIQGEQGVQGVQGMAGTNGADGQDGQDGTDGTDGVGIQSIAYNATTCQLDVTMADSSVQNVDFDLSTVIPEVAFDDTIQAYILIESATGCGLARMPIDICPCDDPAGDTTPPTKLSATPADGATGINEFFTPTITFNEAIDLASAQANLCIRDSLGNDIPVIVTLTNGSMTANIDPTAALAAGETYQIVAKAGLSDLAGNTIGAEDICATFTVEAAAATCDECHEETNASGTRIDWSTLTPAPFLSSDLENGATQTFTNVMGTGVGMTLDESGDVTFAQIAGAVGEESLYVENSGAGLSGFTLTFDQPVCILGSIGPVEQGFPWTITADAPMTASARPDNPGGTGVLTVAGNGTNTIGLQTAGGDGNANAVLSAPNVTSLTFTNEGGGAGGFHGLYIDPDCTPEYWCYDAAAGTYTNTATAEVVTTPGEWVQVAAGLCN